jgi:hypothetical protein
MGIKEQLKELEDKISIGLEKAYSKMVEFKKQKNTPLIISKDGEIVEIDAHKITTLKKD